MFTSMLILLATLTTTAPAQAGFSVDIVWPNFHIVLDPWSPNYTPAPRPGYYWVAGSFDAWGSWHPGHWVPTFSKPGYVWSNGYWVGTRYYEGTWRPASYSSHRWVEGRYVNGRYQAGYWAAERADRAENYRDRSEDYRDRSEDRTDRLEDARDPVPGDREDYYDRMEDVRDRAENRTDRSEDYRDRRH